MKVLTTHSDMVAELAIFNAEEILFDNWLIMGNVITEETFSAFEYCNIEDFSSFYFFGCGENIYDYKGTIANIYQIMDNEAFYDMESSEAGIFGDLVSENEEYMEYWSEYDLMIEAWEAYLSWKNGEVDNVCYIEQVVVPVWEA